MVSYMFTKRGRIAAEASEIPAGNHFDWLRTRKSRCPGGRDGPGATMGARPSN